MTEKTFDKLKGGHSTMTEKTFDSWAIVELFGHSKIAGRVTEQQIAGGTFLRVDVPDLDGQAAFTRFYGAGAIYSITPLDEAMARRVAGALSPRPVTVYGVALPERGLPPPEGEDRQEWDDDDEDYDDEEWDDDDGNYDAA
jgi:hypothetical protein